MNHLSSEIRHLNNCEAQAVIGGDDEENVQIIQNDNSSRGGALLINEFYVISKAEGKDRDRDPQRTRMARVCVRVYLRARAVISAPTRVI